MTGVDDHADSLAEARPTVQMAKTDATVRTP
jgi:hypothetical protein